MAQLNVAVFEVIASERIENTPGKGESADYRHFLIFPQYFEKKKISLSRNSKKLNRGKNTLFDMENMKKSEICRLRKD